MSYPFSITEIQLRTYLSAIIPFLIEELGPDSPTVRGMQEAVAASERAEESAFNQLMTKLGEVTND